VVAGIEVGQAQVKKVADRSPRTAEFSKVVDGLMRKHRTTYRARAAEVNAMADRDQLLRKVIKDFDQELWKKPWPRNGIEEYEFNRVRSLDTALKKNGL
jgi:hypothetical protein